MPNLMPMQDMNLLRLCLSEQFDGEVARLIRERVAYARQHRVLHVKTGPFEGGGEVRARADCSGIVSVADDDQHPNIGSVSRRVVVSGREHGNAAHILRVSK